MFLYNEYQLNSRLMLGAAPSDQVDVTGGVQMAKPMQKDLVLSWLGQLYFTQPTEADASHQRYSAIPCADLQAAGGDCTGPNAADTLKSVPAGALVLANLANADPSKFVDVIVASSPAAAKQYAAPGSDYAVIQGSMTAGTSGGAVQTTKSSTPMLVGALVGGVGGFVVGGPIGALVGGVGGAVIGNAATT